MESSTSKTEIMKPLFLKAGIPLALSIAGLIYAKIIAKKNIFSASNPLEAIDENTSFDEEIIIGLRSRIEEVKELETVLMEEVKNMLVLEAANVEFLKRDIFSSMEAENLRLVEQLRFAKLENGMLKRKVRKILLRNMKEKSRIIRGKKLKIDAAEEEMLRLCNDLETKSSVVINKLEDRVEELQNIVYFLQEEKNELLIRLNDAESSASSTIKIDAEYVTKEEYNEVVKELEQLREERATEIAEFIYLKWNNACLKHELLRNHEQEEQTEEKRNHLKVLEMNGNGEIQDSRLDHQEDDGISILGEKEAIIGVATRNNCDQRVSEQSRTEQSDKLSEKSCSHEHGNSRRKKLLHKIKKWVEGNENVKPRNEEKEKQEMKCFGRLSVSEKAEEDLLVQARRSCSSA